MTELFNLTNKVAMVTGGAIGIGKALALGLASHGADLYLPVYDLTGAEEMKKEVEALGRRIFIHVVDLSKPESAIAEVTHCMEKFGRLDIVINNAGIIKRSPILEGTNQDWQSVIDINLSTVYYISREASKIMKEQGSGKIINIASMLSFQGGKFVPSYTASKHGVAGLTKAFANELAEFNIQTNAIAPGYIETNNTAPIRADEKRNAEILSRIPANRWGQVTDLVGAAIFLSSTASDYVNGHVLAIDGGWLAR
ncbi:2-dehydro-3-deoxy-D-gluconate 5-dehydrogenase KduD [Entomospira entomophila]|uniref:2-dehydro-3-deoxy-D-gluconate 5-dehydrogenase KduD n=1 Tax=Entomospira entomophila TaxID=2719988 RepID=A0A968GAX5_9SPIO|nr:2-dehydro-3-deoxy-D-gluconate 5-dehydrogenase KduD [Entomospira entomophilus]NIZ41020.1 2-dehydro-3-deoxy-D-gluconate 5-dehydrogenase KduD [Entomospira entomophilus]WDI35232.1 2-dehydro-3-deoxy-D-gluconate 5-dehydrogenase KduD [Entomospira entomophilus]